jgi:MoxR-like ATPase
MPHQRESFRSIVEKWDENAPLTLEHCQAAFKALIADIGERIKGQAQLICRIVQAILLNAHALLQGLPGGGKTSAVTACAAAAGMSSRRIQYRPDAMPNELIGGRTLKLDKDGKAYFDFYDGPLYSTVIVADEFNRAPPKIQTATLEAMGERQITRTDKGTTETIYDPLNRAELTAWAGWGCFGLSIPDPHDAARATFVVFATQNPIEMEGTYPLSEAQIDRFTYMLLLHPPALDWFGEILAKNLPPIARPFTGPPVRQPAAAGSAASNSGPEAAPEASWSRPAGPVPLWIKTTLMLEWLRGELLTRQDSPLMRLMDKAEGRQRGLWDRVRLVILLSHYRHGDTGLGMAGDDPLTLDLRDEYQRYIRSFLANWFEHRFAGSNEVADRVKETVKVLLTNRLFEAVESGASARGLQDWPKAAVAAAFLETRTPGKFSVRRRHLRGVADDVLRHRIRLTAQARADQVRTTDLIHLLVDTLLPEIDNEEREDSVAILPPDADVFAEAPTP